MGNEEELELKYCDYYKIIFNKNKTDLLTRIYSQPPAFSDVHVSEPWFPHL